MTCGLKTRINFAYIYRGFYSFSNMLVINFDIGIINSASIIV